MEKPHRGPLVRSLCTAFKFGTLEEDQHGYWPHGVKRLGFYLHGKSLALLWDFLIAIIILLRLLNGWITSSFGFSSALSFYPGCC